MARPPWLHLLLDVPSSRWTDSVPFWAAVTGTSVSPLRGEREQFVTLLPAEGAAWVKLQSIDGPEPRVHLDLDGIDRARSVRFSVAAGAVPAWSYPGVAVMRSPGGLLFCHTVADSGDQPHLHRGETEVVLDQVCIDIPSRCWRTEVTFWQTPTGRDLERGLRPEFALLGDRADPAGAPRILLQRLDDDAPAVSAHPDFATGHRHEQARRHESLGATIVSDFPRWTVMRAPSGHVYCLTDRDPATGSVDHR